MTATRSAHLLAAAAALLPLLVARPSLAAAPAPAPAPAAASPASHEVIAKALQEEIARGMTLSLPGLQKPCFVGYEIRDMTTLSVVASLGGIVTSQLDRRRATGGRLLVGSFERSDENFESGLFGGFRGRQYRAQVPLEDDVLGIRRALWLAMDQSYKRAAETYEEKKAALAQQTAAEDEAKLADFSAAPKVELTVPMVPWQLDPAAWERLARDASALFKAHPEIQSSEVSVTLYQAQVVYVSSEGTRVAYPLELASLEIDAATQAADGQTLSNFAYFHARSPADLPKAPQVAQAAKAVAAELLALRSAKTLDQSYAGPVLFEDQAAAELFSQRFFSGQGGLLAVRVPATADPSHAAAFEQMLGRPLTDLLGKRLLPTPWTIVAQPHLKARAGVTLLGSYEVDAQGVRPPDRVVLVDKGVLKTLLSGRTPVKGVAESNGHQRRSPDGGEAVAPSVITVTHAAAKAPAELKKALLAQARQQGLDHAFVVRRLTPAIGGMQGGGGFAAMLARARRTAMGQRSLSDPVLVYRVKVSDGKEELVRAASLGWLSQGELKRVSAASKQEYIYNTLASPSAGPFSYGGSGGIPATFVVPRAVLVDELEIEPDKGAQPRLPVVPSPIAGR